MEEKTILRRHGEVKRKATTLTPARVEKGWTADYIQNLPPAAFAVGREWPHHDHNGNVDQGALLKAISGLAKSKASSQERAAAYRHLVDHIQPDSPIAKELDAASEVAFKATFEAWPFKQGDTGHGTFHRHEVGLTPTQFIATKHLPHNRAFAPGREEIAWAGDSGAIAFTRAASGATAELAEITQKADLPAQKAFAPISTSIDVRLAVPGGAEWYGGEIDSPGSQYTTNVLTKYLDGMEARAPFLGLIKGTLDWMEIGEQPAPIMNGETLDRHTLLTKFNWEAGLQGHVMGDETIHEFKFWNEDAEGILQFTKQRGAQSVRLLSPGAAQSQFTVAIGKSAPAMQKYIPIMKMDEDLRLVTGIVLQPEVVDAQDDIYNAEEVRKAAHGFLAGFNRVTKLGFQHREFNRNFELVESWIAPVPISISGRLVKAGSWIMTVKVLDDEVWSQVKRGLVTGFSIGGIARSVRVRP